MRDKLCYLFSAVVLGILLSMPMFAAAQQTNTRISCRFEPPLIQASQTATLIIEVSDVLNLYGYELKMTYDPARIQFNDADTSKEAINLQLGAFISPDFILFNKADSGTVHLALTQLAPVESKSGSGELVRSTLQGTGEGFANFAFGDFTLSDHNGRAIDATVQDCLLEIGVAGGPTPTQTVTPVPSATPTGTTMPAATATHTPVPPAFTNTPWPTPTDVPSSPTLSPQATDTPSTISTSTPTATPSSVIITTPTPAQPAEAMTQGQATQQQPAAPTQTQNSASTPLLPTEQASAEAAEEGQTSDGSAVQADVSGLASENAVASAPGTNAVESKQIPIASLTPTATPTFTPVAFARVAHQPLQPIEVIAQPPPPQPKAWHQRYQWLGWGSLVATGIFVLVTWRLRKSRSL